MNVKSIIGSKLQQAEESFTNAFGVLENIEVTANNAADVAYNEQLKAEAKKLEYEFKENEMKIKANFYTGRAAKVRKFIQSLND